MIEQKTVDMLTTRSVSIKTEVYLSYDGEVYKVKTLRKAYMNSENGRKELENEQPGNIVRAVMEIWGDKATVTDIKNDNTIN